MDESEDNESASISVSESTTQKFKRDVPKQTSLYIPNHPSPTLADRNRSKTTYMHGTTNIEEPKLEPIDMLREYAQYGNTMKKNMKKIIRLHSNLNNAVGKIDSSFQNVIKQHEQDFVVAFNGEMKKVRGELEYLKNKTEAKQNDLMGGKKIVALEKEINWFKTEALRQSNQVKTQKEDIEKWKLKVHSLREDKNFLERKAREGKKHNQLLEMGKAFGMTTISDIESLEHQEIMKELSSVQDSNSFSLNPSARRRPASQQISKRLSLQSIGAPRDIQTAAGGPRKSHSSWLSLNKSGDFRGDSRGDYRDPRDPQSTIVSRHPSNSKVAALIEMQRQLNMDKDKFKELLMRYYMDYFLRKQDVLFSLQKNINKQVFTNNRLRTVNDDYEFMSSNANMLNTLCSCIKSTKHNIAKRKNEGVYKVNIGVQRLMSRSRSVSTAEKLRRQMISANNIKLTQFTSTDKRSVLEKFFLVQEVYTQLKEIIRQYYGPHMSEMGGGKTEATREASSLNKENPDYEEFENTQNTNQSLLFSKEEKQQYLNIMNDPFQAFKDIVEDRKTGFSVKTSLLKGKGKEEAKKGEADLSIVGISRPHTHEVQFRAKNKHYK